MLQEKNFILPKKWKLINYRSVSDLLTAEFLHDLYNRHQPEVNSIRFRNTLCILRGQDFRSYAPQGEWEYLGKQLGNRFYQRDPVLFIEIERYIFKEKKHLNNFLSSLPINLENISCKKLFELLSELHYLSLGEIYGINLVQIEHGLNWAISKHLSNPQDFSKMPDFQWKSQLGIFENTLLTASLDISKKKRSFKEAVQELNEKFEHFTIGYGTGIQTNIQMLLQQLLSISLEERKKRLYQDNSLSEYSSCKFSDLQKIASQVAELRDKNKLLMGIITAKREKLLTLIAKQKKISRYEISRYCLLEIYELIHQNKRLSQKTLIDRDRLVIFKREETFCTNLQAEKLFRNFIATPEFDKRHPFYGTVAAKGIVQGKARIVFSSKDCENLSNTDILVALGTDFDLLHGISTCGGVITEEGGILSHAAIVSRELKKPCLIGISQLLSKVSDGDWIILDCNKGFFKIKNSMSISLPDGMELIHNNLKQNYPAKIYNLNKVISNGFPVLPGICLLDRYENFNNLQKICSQLLKTNTIIIRGCLFEEDQMECSLAGTSCSQVVSNDPKSLKNAFSAIKNQNQNCALLIQPYVHFETGGVVFTNNQLKKVLIEISKDGPFGAVNGKVEKRFSFSFQDLENKNESSYQKVAAIAHQISQDFGYDIDIEWGIERGKFWILQTRPVTIPCDN